MFTSCDNASCSKSSSAIGPDSNQVTVIETPRLSTRPSTNKTVIVGLYGVSGCGKTFLLNQLKQELGHEHHAFFEGSEIIASLVDGNLNSFHKMSENEKVCVRKKAIDWVREKYTGSGMVVVITGHFMFWPEGEEAGSFVYTQNDLGTFTHMRYLNVPVRVIAQYRLKDIERDRPFMSISHISKWQLEETIQLRSLCRENGILFSLMSQHSTMLEKVLMLLHDFQHHSEEANLSMAIKRLDDILKADPRQLDTVLVMDADRTLTAEDTGALFWQKASGSQMLKDEDCQLKTLFKSPLGYSYTAFRQAALLYQEKANDQGFDNIRKDVASAVTMHPEFVSLLQLVAEQEHIGAIVVSCGLQRIWDQVLEKEGLSSSVKVIGGGRINKSFIITAAVKAALHSRLRTLHLKYVWAFGDSPLDLDMLSTANRPIIVVGEEGKRSRAMDAALMDAINNQGLQACQVLLPSNATPRLDTTKLPLVQLTDQDFIDSVLCPRGLHAGAQVIHATHRKTAKLLMTPMRDATIAGPVLREAHRRVGWYLATEFLPDIIGVEEYSISHV